MRRKYRWPAPKRRAGARIRAGRVVMVQAFTLATLLLLGSFAAVFVPGLSSAAVAAAGTPAESRVVFEEDFQNRPDGKAQVLTDYVGKSGMTYAADAYWVNTRNCNGFIFDRNSPYVDGYCAASGSGRGPYNNLSAIPWALGTLQPGGEAEADKNAAVASYTEGSGRDNEIQIRTNGSMRAGSAGQFVTFSVDAGAQNCHARPPLLRFFLVDSANKEIAVNESAINPCTDPRAKKVQALRQDNTRMETSVGSFTSDSSILLTGPVTGLVMRNETGTGAGNDGAFDNIRLLDSTPQLDKSFSPTTLRKGQFSTLTFTITNTSDLVEKEGWSFTDTLPAGMTIGGTAASTTCPSGQVDAPNGGTAVRVSGNLSNKMASCTVTVQVTSANGGSFSNGPDNVTTTGLVAPTPATVKFIDPALKLEKTSDKSALNPGETITYSFKVTNTGDSTVAPVKVSEKSFSGSGAAPTINCPAAADSLAAGASVTCTATYRVTEEDAAKGKIDNTASASGTAEDGTTVAAEDSAAEVKVNKRPTAAADSASTDQGQAVTVDPLANDAKGQDDAPIDPKSVKLSVPDDAPAGSEVSADGKKLTIPGEGVYQVDPNTGAVTFTPDPKFTGTATVVPYQITDSNGNTASSTITVSVNPVPPRANPDTASTEQNTPVKISPAGNDKPGVDNGTPLDPASVRLLDGDGNPVTELTVPGQGTYKVDPETGEVVFTPVPGFKGEADPVRYRIADTAGNTSTSTITVTVTPAPAPKANDDAPPAKPQGQEQSVNPLDNDTPGNPGSPLDPKSVKLSVDGLPEGSTVSDDGKTVVVPGEGTYTVDPETGVVTFVPDSTFTGTATPVVYTVKDNNGNTATAKVTFTVDPVPPRANPDEDSVTQGQSKTVEVAGNDKPGIDNGTPLDPASVRLLDDDGKPVTELSNDSGKYVVNPDGTVTFTPAPGVSGPQPPVRYQISDSKGQTSTSTLTMTVDKAAPEGKPDTASTPQNTPVTVDPLANDSFSPGSPADPASVTLAVPDNAPAGSSVSADGKTLTIPGEGVYTVNADGKVGFVPEKQFTGTATPVPYQAKDVNGNPLDSTITIEVAPVNPTLTPDEGSTKQGVPVTIDVLANDAPGGTTSIDKSSVQLLPGDSAGSVSADGKVLTVPGEGVYRVNSDGTVTFTPEPGFAGPSTKRIGYSVADSNGTVAESTIDIKVSPIVPVANPDSAQQLPGKPVTVNLLDNDTPGDPAFPLDPSTVKLLPGDSAGSVSADGKVLTVPGEGVYRVNFDGTVTFTPEPGFLASPTPIGYTVADGNGTVAESTITINAVPAPLPDIVKTTVQDKAITISTDIKTDGYFIGPDGVPTTTLVTPEGVFVVDESGTVTFTPATGFTGPVPAVTLYGKDSDGNPAQQKITVTVTPLPVVPDDEKLPETGFAVLGLGALGALLLIGGAVVLRLNIRRRTS